MTDFEDRKKIFSAIRIGESGIEAPIREMVRSFPNPWSPESKVFTNFSTYSNFRNKYWSLITLNRPYNIGFHVMGLEKVDKNYSRKIALNLNIPLGKMRKYLETMWKVGLLQKNGDVYVLEDFEYFDLLDRLKQPFETLKQENPSVRPVVEAFTGVYDGPQIDDYLVNLSGKEPITDLMEMGLIVGHKGILASSDDFRINWDRLKPIHEESPHLLKKYYIIRNYIIKRQGSPANMISENLGTPISELNKDLLEMYKLGLVSRRFIPELGITVYYAKAEEYLNDYPTVHTLVAANRLDSVVKKLCYSLYKEQELTNSQLKRDFSMDEVQIGGLSKPFSRVAFITKESWQLKNGMAKNDIERSLALIDHVPAPEDKKVKFIQPSSKDLDEFLKKIIGKLRDGKNG